MPSTHLEMASLVLLLNSWQKWALEGQLPKVEQSSREKAAFESLKDYEVVPPVQGRPPCFQIFWKLWQQGGQDGGGGSYHVSDVKTIGRNTQKPISNNGNPH